MNHSTDFRGLTIAELMIVMVITLMLSGLVMSFTLDFWGRTANLQNNSDTLVTRQSLGDSLRDSFNRASSMAIQPSIPDPQTLVPDPARAEGTFWVPIHAVPKTISKPATNQYVPVVYFMAPSLHSDRTQIMNGTQPFQDEFVLYLSGTGELRLRTLTSPNASGNMLKNTCSPHEASTACPPDKLLAQDVSKVSTRYFSRSGNPQNWESVIDPDPDPGAPVYIGPDMPTVEVLELTVGFERRAVMKKSATTKNETTVRIALRNG